MGDGGRDEPEPVDADGTEEADGVVAGADVAADVVPEFAAAALALVQRGLAVLLGVRHAALSAGELRALSREITAQQGTLASAWLRTLASMDARDDVVPKARAGQASLAFQQHALGIDPHTARRDSATAQLLDPDTGDLKAIGAAFAAGEVLRGHVDVAVRTHRDLGERIREELIPARSRTSRGVSGGSRRWTRCSRGRPGSGVCASWTGSPAPWSRS